MALRPRWADSPLQPLFAGCKWFPRRSRAGARPFGVGSGGTIQNSARRVTAGAGVRPRCGAPLRRRSAQSRRSRRRRGPPCPGSRRPTAAPGSGSRAVAKECRLAERAGGSARSPACACGRGRPQALVSSARSVSRARSLSPARPVSRARSVSPARPVSRARSPSRRGPFRGRARFRWRGRLPWVLRRRRGRRPGAFSGTSVRARVGQGAQDVGRSVVTHRGDMIAQWRPIRSSSRAPGLRYATIIPEFRRNLKRLTPFYVVVVSRYAARAAPIDFKKYSD